MKAGAASTHDHREQLGEQLCGLAEEISSPLVSITSIGTLPERRLAGCFRLRYANGLTLKGRNFESEEEALRVQTLLHYLDCPFFPRVLAVNGRAMLSEWIPGETIPVSGASPDILEEAGSLQGLLHSSPEPPAVISSRPPGSPGSALELKTERLLLAGALTEGEADTLLRIALRDAPLGSPTGVIHGDFCGENIVVSPQGKFFLVDNEAMSTGFLDYDLGRTWYRWALGREELRAYLRGYRRHRDPRPFLTHFSFWVLCALVDSALFRLREGIPGAPSVTAKLRAFLDRHERIFGIPTRPGR